MVLTPLLKVAPVFEYKAPGLLQELPGTLFPTPQVGTLGLVVKREYSAVPELLEPATSSPRTYMPTHWSVSLLEVPGFDSVVPVTSSRIVLGRGGGEPPLVNPNSAMSDT
jgi:hypothetical protein